MIIGSKKIFVDKLSSTNTHASWLLKKGPVQEGTIVHTNFQTAGKGQPGNTWDSQYGKNLLFSIVLYPHTVKAENQFIISKMISLAIRDFLLSKTTDVFIKWPNDIYVRNDKIAGILIENTIIRSEIETCIAGIGLNINQEIFSPKLPNPTSLRIITKKEYDLDECLTGLAVKTDDRYKLMLRGKNSAIDTDYLSSLYRFGVFTEFSDSDGVFEGRITAVTGTGRLQIEDRRGRILEYGFREVDFL